MNKSLTAFLSVVGVATLLVACTPSAPTGDTTGENSSTSSILIMEPGADGQEDEAMEVEDDGQEDDDGAITNGMPVPGSTVDEMVVSDQNARIIAITADNFSFGPNAITAKKGEKVTLRVTSTEGNHGFGVPDLGINTAVSEGKTVHIELPTDKTGTFNFKCSVPCGSGHRDMTGTITITE